MRREAGFTLIELMVTAGITVIITGLLVANFSRTRVDLNRATIAVTDGIREAQSLALTGAAVRGTSRCGYGIHFTAGGFVIYAGPESSAVDCSVQDRNYDTSDTVIRAASLANASIEIVLPADDIFFEPPDPTTYLNGSPSPTGRSIIYVRRLNAVCAGLESMPDCRVITVSGTGRIQTQ
jgi:type II secretory pathway pseudopilin PulG